MEPPECKRWPRSSTIVSATHWHAGYGKPADARAVVLLGWDTARKLARVVVSRASPGSTTHGAAAFHRAAGPAGLVSSW